MSAFPTYSTGTVAISANGTTVAGTGSNWTGQNAMSGDTLSVAGFGQVIIASVTDATTLVIDAWPFGAVSAGTTYKIYKNSSSRFVGAQTAVAVDKMVTAINTSGFYVFVGSDETVPDPSLGDDDQYALQATTGKIWQKEGGVWTFVGTFKGFGTPAPWDSATAYVAFDVVSFEGASYVCIEANTNEQPSNGDSPPNAFWTVLAAQGEAATVTVGTVTTGAGGSSAAVSNSGTMGAAVLDFTIPAGEGYGGTSTTSLAIGTGSKAFTTQSGLAYQVGNYVRASSAASGVNYMEGNVTAYSGTTLAVNITRVGGSGTKADWNFQVAGAPGSGDLLSTNNLSDVASTSTALSNLGGVPTTTTISGSGLVSGGGDLSSDRTVTVTAASKSDQQTGTSSTVAVTPAHQQDHASAAKAWCLDNGAATPVASASYNISSLTDNGVGDTTFNFTTAMSSANYSVVALFQTSVPFTTAAATRSFDLISATASGVRLATGFWASNSGSGIDFPLRMAVFGVN